MEECFLLQELELFGVQLQSLKRQHPPSVLPTSLSVQGNLLLESLAFFAGGEALSTPQNTTN